jgi:hypothetical protein
MKRLLLWVCVTGAAVYAVNTQVIIQGPVSVQAPATHPPVRHLRSWGSYLSDLPLSQNPQAQLASYQKPDPLPPQQNAAADERAAASASEDSEHESAEWAKVATAARVHKEASVSSVTLRYYLPGRELQVVGREGGWVGVSDPVTQERGWVFEKYLASIDAPSLTQAALDSTSASELSEPSLAKPALPDAKKRTPLAPAPVRVSQVTPVSDAAVTELDPQSGRWARRGDRRRGGLFTFGPFAGF